MIIENLVRALRNVEKLERGESAAINPQDCEECVEKGWLEPLPGGGYALTNEGRKTLANHA
jgi:hypothetical protein